MKYCWILVWHHVVAPLQKQNQFVQLLSTPTLWPVPCIFVIILSNYAEGKGQDYHKMGLWGGLLQTTPLDTWVM